MNNMNQPLGCDFSFSNLVYVKGMDRQLSPEARQVIKKAFICEASWASRVLKSASCSHERSELMKKMYDDIHMWSQELNRVLGQKSYFIPSAIAAFKP